MWSCWVCRGAIAVIVVAALASGAGLLASAATGIATAAVGAASVTTSMTTGITAALAGGIGMAAGMLVDWICCVVGVTACCED